nr:hypothetical protein [Streptomyces sp. N35]
MAGSDADVAVDDDALYVLTAVLLTPAKFPSVLGDDYPEACAALGLVPIVDGYGLVLGQDSTGARWTVVTDDVSLVAVAIASWDCGMEYELSPDDSTVVSALPGWPLAVAVAAPGIPAPHDPEPDPDDPHVLVLSPPDTTTWGPAQRRLGADEIALQWAMWRAQIDDDAFVTGGEGSGSGEESGSGAGSDSAGEGEAAEGPERPGASEDVESSGTAAAEGTVSDAYAGTDTDADSDRNSGGAADAAGTDAPSDRADSANDSAADAETTQATTEATAEESADSDTAENQTADENAAPDEAHAPTRVGAPEDTTGRPDTPSEGTADQPGTAPEATADQPDPAGPGTAASGSAIRRVLAEVRAYIDTPPPLGRVRSAFATGEARTLRADGPGWSMVARTDDIAFVLLDEEPGEVLPVGRGPELPGLLEALDKMAVRPS